jgi:hypothetical protein
VHLRVSDEPERLALDPSKQLLGLEGRKIEAHRLFVESHPCIDLRARRQTTSAHFTSQGAGQDAHTRFGFKVYPKFRLNTKTPNPEPWARRAHTQLPVCRAAVHKRTSLCSDAMHE